MEKYREAHDIFFRVTNQEPGSDASLRNLIASVKQRNAVGGGETVAETAVYRYYKQIIGHASVLF